VPCLFGAFAIPAWYNPAPTGMIFMKSDISAFLENMSKKLKFHLNVTRIAVIYMETNIREYMIVTRLVLLRMSNFSEKPAEKIKIHILL
jgi:hypothetical protein